MIKIVAKVTGGRSPVFTGGIVYSNLLKGLFHVTEMVYKWYADCK